MSRDVIVRGDDLVLVHCDCTGYDSVHYKQVRRSAQPVGEATLSRAGDPDGRGPWATDIRDPDDEMVATGFIHIERMDDNRWWIGIYTADGKCVHVNFWTKKAKIYSSMDAWDDDYWQQRMAALAPAAQTPVDAALVAGGDCDWPAADAPQKCEHLNQRRYKSGPLSGVRQCMDCGKAWDGPAASATSAGVGARVSELENALREIVGMCEVDAKHTLRKECGVAEHYIARAALESEAQRGAN